VSPACFGPPSSTPTSSLHNPRREAEAISQYAGDEKQLSQGGREAEVLAGPGVEGLMDASIDEKTDPKPTPNRPRNDPVLTLKGRGNEDCLLPNE